MIMIKKFKIFLESVLENDIVSNIEDILRSLKDDDKTFRSVLRFYTGGRRKTIKFIIEGKIDISDIEIVEHLNSYLLSEGFSFLGDEELDISFSTKTLTTIRQAQNFVSIGVSTPSKFENIFKQFKIDNSEIYRIYFYYYLPDSINYVKFKDEIQKNKKCL